MRYIRANWCNQCKTGAYFYMLDSHDVVCPYLNACTEEGCPMFEKLESVPASDLTEQE